MKYIKEYSEYKQFTPEDVEELKDVYQDIVDDLGLYDNPFQILKVDDSSFQLPNKYEGKMCKIFIRTIVTEMWHFGEMKEVTKEELNHHNHMLQLLEPHITRIKNMGYIIIVKDRPIFKTDGMLAAFTKIGYLNIDGIEIHITKKPHQ
jgi:hypothetical protein